MKYFIGFIIGLLISGTAYAYRFSKPQRITEFDDRALVIINESLEQLWDAVNGRYTLDVEITAPTKTADEGDIVAYSSGGVYRIYIYLNGAWRAFTSD